MKRHSAAEVAPQRRIASSDTRHSVQNNVRSAAGPQHGYGGSNVRLQPKENIENSGLNKSFGFNNSKCSANMKKRRTFF